MIDAELLAKAEVHYQQLAPHVKQRETAQLLKQLINALKNTQGYPFVCGD